MASSKLMMSSTKNSDLPPNSITTVSESQSSSAKSPGSMNMDDLLQNIYEDALTPETEDNNNNNNNNSKSVEEVWNDIVSGSNDQVRGGTGGGGEMTLEDFLTKAGAVREDDIRLSSGVVVQVGGGVGSYGVDSYGNGGLIGGGNVVGEGRGGRGKRRVAVEEAVVDKATQQKQRRMIKNRESAARSRERKQAYTVELESLVTQLEEDNAKLLKEEAEQSKKRYKLLMENLIPVVEKQKTPRVLRRLHSASW